MKHRAWGLKWKKTLYWIIWNMFQDNSLYAFGIKTMSMQTLTWDVDAVDGNSDAYSLALATQTRQDKNCKLLWICFGIV